VTVTSNSLSHLSPRQPTFECSSRCAPCRICTAMRVPFNCLGKQVPVPHPTCIVCKARLIASQRGSAISCQCGMCLCKDSSSILACTILGNTVIFALAAASNPNLACNGANPATSSGEQLIWIHLLIRRYGTTHQELDSVFIDSSHDTVLHVHSTAIASALSSHAVNATNDCLRAHYNADCTRS